ncbi:MAG: hypothetical protein JSU82_14515 [Rhodospirillales bacterium]|nr:MAG: hypothetical protein JSU82_14515 [Rhodospirillales bacterium]
MTASLPVPSRRGDAVPRRRVSSPVAAACCALLLALAGCKADADLKKFEISGLETMADQRLADAIALYYRTEAARKWSALYDLRHPAFRREVSRKAFVAAMRRDWRDWHFNGVEVEGLRGIGGRGVSVSMVFDEVVKSQDAALEYDVIWFKRPWWDEEPKISAKTRSFSSWVEVRGRWYPIQSGLRLHVAYDLAAIN